MKESIMKRVDANISRCEDDIRLRAKIESEIRIAKEAADIMIEGSKWQFYHDKLTQLLK